MKRSLKDEYRHQLKILRQETGETQAQFSKRLGMTQQQYARLEHEGSNPTLKTVQKIADTIGLALVFKR